MVQFGLPDDYFATYPAAIAALDLPAVDAAGKAAIDPTRVVCLVVGDGQQIEAASAPSASATSAASTPTATRSKGADPARRDSWAGDAFRTARLPPSSRQPSLDVLHTDTAPRTAPWRKGRRPRRVVFGRPPAFFLQGGAR